VKCEIEPRDIETGKVDAVVNAIVIGIVFEKCVVPRFESMADINSIPGDVRGLIQAHAGVAITRSADRVARVAGCTAIELRCP
jgi:hypothetical protein